MIAESILCLALNIYHEARGEGPEGMMAVATVTLNRVAHVDWPDSICEVVYQPAQFSWTAATPQRPGEPEAWATSKAVATDVLLGEATSVLDHTALFYHAVRVRPAWRHDLRLLGQIGAHRFYGYPEPTPRPVTQELRPRPRPETRP
jgi:N-acetylmuramoyl-L-alanine amidase